MPFALAEYRLRRLALSKAHTILSMKTFIPAVPAFAFAYVTRRKGRAIEVLSRGCCLSRRGMSSVRARSSCMSSRDE